MMCIHVSAVFVTAPLKERERERERESAEEVNRPMLAGTDAA